MEAILENTDVNPNTNQTNNCASWPCVAHSFMKPCENGSHGKKQISHGKVMEFYFQIFVGIQFKQIPRNTVFSHINTVFSHINTVFSHINTVFSHINTVFSHINAVITHKHSVLTHKCCYHTQPATSSSGAVTSTVEAKHWDTLKHCHLEHIISHI